MTRKPTRKPDPQVQRLLEETRRFEAYLAGVLAVVHLAKRAGVAR